MAPHGASQCEKSRGDVALMGLSYALRLQFDTVDVAALYVEEGGAYETARGVDLWDVTRDARDYAGPFPVVAHPPCARWCRVAGMVEKVWGYKKGDDGGTFAAALAAVRRWGGVLEHPAFSDAWAAYGMPRPPRQGGWVRGDCGGFSCHVEQSRYGHAAKKATWLYAFGVDVLPELRWGSVPDREITARVSWCGNRIWTGERRRRLRSNEASATPAEFRDVLLSIARSAGVSR